MVATQFIEQGHGARQVLGQVNITPSQYYYRPGKGKRGRPPSQVTFTSNGAMVSNEQVINDMEKLFEGEFVDYGYIKTTHWLRGQKQYIISFKKTYRLMKKNNLLLNKRWVNRSPRTWVKELVPQVDVPFKYIEIDIKYIYIHGERKNAMMLTAIDVMSRLNMGFVLQYSVKKQDVAALFSFISEHFALPQGVTVRNDNGSQFTTHLVRQHLHDLGIAQEFTKPATPEQNAHIEAYHSIVERAVCQRFQFDHIKQAQGTFDRFWLFYNFDRIHSGVGYTSPEKYLQQLGIELDRKDFYPCGWTLETSANERNFEEGLMGLPAPDLHSA